MTKKKSVRTAVVDAALDLVETLQDSNAGQLTLDAVAAKAGVSKGGLLHHFKSKEALLTAMVERLADNFEAEHQQGIDRLRAHPGDTVEHEVEMISAYLNRSFSGLGERSRSATTLFAAGTYQQSLLQPIRDLWERRNQEVLDRSGSPHAMIALTLLADGLWLFDALGIPPVTGKLREELLVTIKGWAQQIVESNGSAPARKTSSKTKVSTPALAPTPTPKPKPAAKTRKK